MRLLAVVGQRNRALRQFQELRDAVRRELDTEPEPASLELERAIRERRFPQTARVPVCVGRSTSENVDVQLSPREREVAGLLARQLTNRQIAISLQVSPRTADTHVSRILRKLGVASRRDVATWVLERGFFGLLVLVPHWTRDWFTSGLPDYVLACIAA